MKKLLSILASVGLVATSSAAVVACTASIPANDVAVLQNGYTYIHDEKIDLVSDVKKGASNDITSQLKAFDNDGNKSTLVSGLKVTLTDNIDVVKDKDGNVKSTTVNKDLNSGDSVHANIEFFIDTTKVGPKTDMTVKLGNGTDKLDKTAVEISLTTPMSWNNGIYDGTKVTATISATLADKKTWTPDNFKVIDPSDNSSVSLTSSKWTANKDGKNGTITVEFTPKEKRGSAATKDDWQKQTSYEWNDEDFVAKRGNITFTIPPVDAPLNPTDNGGSTGGNTPGGNPVKPSEDGTVSQSFKAAIKGATDSKTLASLFAIKDKDGNDIQGDYSFIPDPNKAYVLANDAPVSGTVTVKFTPTGSGAETFTIDESDAAKKSGAVTGFTPVKVSVDIPEGKSTVTWSNGNKTLTYTNFKIKAVKAIAKGTDSNGGYGTNPLIDMFGLYDENGNQFNWMSTDFNRKDQFEIHFATSDKKSGRDIKEGDTFLVNLTLNLSDTADASKYAGKTWYINKAGITVPADTKTGDVTIITTPALS